MNLTDLPLTLVPFLVHHEPKGCLVWKLSECDIAPQTFLNLYSYTVNSGSSVYKIVYADCYGGGLAGNGGSARCGYDFRYQVKGIGLTPLVGRRADPFHSTGRLALGDALSEVIWSEVLGVVCPYGVVRQVGVIEIPKRGNVDSSECGREALLVREAPVRLAHLERAFRFVPLAKNLHLIPRDALRVRSCFGMLERILGIESSCDEDAASRVTDNLRQSVERIARQLAFAHANLIKLGATPSNIELSGKLLDLTHAFCMWPMAADEPHRYLQFYRASLGEQKPILGCFENICYYLKKYRPEICDVNLHAVLRASYAKSYLSQFENSTLFRFGLCKSSAGKVSGAVRSRIRAAYAECLLRPDSWLFSIGQSGFPILIEQIGLRCNIEINSNRLYAHLACDQLLIDGLVEAISGVHNGRTAGRRRITKLIFLRMVQRFIFLTLFSQKNVNETVDRLLQAENSEKLCEAFSDKLRFLSRTADYCFGESSDQILLLSNQGLILYLDVKTNFLVLKIDKTGKGDCYTFDHIEKLDPNLISKLKQNYPPEWLMLLDDILSSEG